MCALAEIAGVTLGVAGSALVARVVDWPLIIASTSIAAAFPVSVGGGVLFGYLPATRSASMNPIDALRRE